MENLKLFAILFHPERHEAIRRASINLPRCLNYYLSDSVRSWCGIDVETQRRSKDQREKQAAREVVCKRFSSCGTTDNTEAICHALKGNNNFGMSQNFKKPFSRRENKSIFSRSMDIDLVNKNKQRIW